MPSLNATPTPITPPRVPLIDPRTGLIDRAWYLFFLSLLNAATTIDDNPNIGPSAESLIASYDAALQALAQNVDTQPVPVDLSAELTKQIEAAGLVDQSSALLSQIAELQKQVDALNMTPPPLQGTVTEVTGTAPVVSSGGTAPNISMAAASASTDGYLTSTDWNTFNSKAPATSGTSILYGNGSGGFSNVTIGTGVSFAGGTLSATGSGGTVTSVTATTPLASSGGATPNLTIQQATTSQSGYLTSTDWNTFNNKQPAGTYVTSVTGTAPVVSSGGTTPAISMAAANGSTNGYLTSTDWTTFNSKQPAGSYVTAVSVASANGFAGTSSGGTTPSLTLTTSISGLLYGNGTALAGATVSAPLTYSAGTLAITQATTSTNGYLGSTDWNTFNNKQSVSAPVTKTADFSVAATDLWLINNKSGSTCTATLPAASSYSGRVLHFQNYQAQALVSASSNVVPLAGGAAGTSILLAVAGDSATLVSDGSNWLMTQYVPNNILLLE
jgi:hypothetical protein